MLQNSATYTNEEITGKQVSRQAKEQIYQDLMGALAPK